MARPPRVTRTIKTTVCKVLAMDLSTEQPMELEITLPRAYKPEEGKRLFQAVCQAVDSAERKAVAIQEARTEAALYGMTEAEFLRHAVELPPRKTTSDQNNDQEKGEISDV